MREHTSLLPFFIGAKVGKGKKIKKKMAGRLQNEKKIYLCNTYKSKS